MWVRGLKHNKGYTSMVHLLVAPYVGAWIETRVAAANAWNSRVAPYVGAWIEPSFTWESQKCGSVAPYVGAWIET